VKDVDVAISDFQSFQFFYERVIPKRAFLLSSFFAQAAAKKEAKKMPLRGTKKS
jgi:hypothetical protein